LLRSIGSVWRVDPRDDTIVIAQRIEVLSVDRSTWNYYRSSAISHDHSSLAAGIQAGAEGSPVAQASTESKRGA
jgi:hypothetical protein